MRSIGDTPVRTEKISERVAREIVRDVAAAGVTVGVKLPSEPEMCDRYGVGRGSLREALRILEVQGLISIKAGPGGGPTVAGMSSERLGATAALHLQFAGATLLSVAEARVVLEPVLARQAAVQADRAIVARLTHLSAAPSTGNFERDLRMSGAFHTEVARASGNPVLALLGDAMREIWSARLRSVVYAHENPDEVRAEHHDIARAIQFGRPGQAGELMLRHLERFVDLARTAYPEMLTEALEWH